MKPKLPQLNIGDTIRCHYPFGTVDLTVYNIVGNRAMTKRGQWKDKTFHANIFDRKYVYVYGQRIDPVLKITYEVIREGAVPVKCVGAQVIMSI